MVTRIDLKLPSSDIHAICAKMQMPDSDEDPVDYFAALSWAVICEPGDAFAGQLISTFGAARALALEIARTSASEYEALFAAAGSDWLEMQKFGRFEKTLSDARERWLPRLSTAKVNEAVEVMQSIGGWFLTQKANQWPAGLNDLGLHAPRGLWGIGKPPSAVRRSISVVGSRGSSSYGELATFELLGPLIEKGIGVVSGGAYGIDSHAHRATVALDGFTTAVMAGGLDRLYPSGNRELFKAIAQRGSLVSEMPPGAEPTKWRFLQRNRLIAALGSATLVVEATSRSGAVSTANRSVDLGRPLGAVPGPINSPGSDGCHQLIRDLKAQLITCSADILELLGENSSTASSEELGLGALETRVLDVIGHTTADTERIRVEGGLTSAEAELGISGLSLMGLVEQDAMGWRRRL